MLMTLRGEPEPVRPARVQRPDGGAGVGGPDSLRRRRVHPYSLHYPLLFARSEALMVRAHDFLMDGAFGTGFSTRLVAVTSGPVDEDEGLELGLTNSQAFKTALARFHRAAQHSLRATRLVVMRIPRNPKAWLLEDYVVENESMGGAILPMQVEALQPTEGDLWELDDGRGPVFYEYVPKDEARAKKFEYRIYTDPTVSGPLTMPVEDFVALYGNLLRYYPKLRLTGDLQMMVDGAGGFGGSQAADQLCFIASPLWAAMMAERRCDEVYEASLQVTYANAYTRAVFAKKPLPAIAPEAIGQDFIQHASSIGEAAADEQRHLADKDHQMIAAYLKRQVSDPAEVRGFAPYSKRQRVRYLADRDDPNDDPIELPADIELKDAARPTLATDHLQWRAEYEKLVSQLFGGLPVSDLNASYVASSTRSTLAGGGGARGRNTKDDETSVDKAREALFEHVRTRISDVQAWAYSWGLAQYNMLLLNEKMELLLEFERRRLTAMLKNSASASASSATKGRRGELRKRKLAWATILNDGKEPAEDAPLPTVEELKREIQDRIKEDRPFQLVIVFDADRDREAADSQLMDFERLPPHVQEGRRQMADMMGKMSEKAVVSEGSTQAFVNKAFGVQAEAAPDRERKQRLKPPPAKKAKKS